MCNRKVSSLVSFVSYCSSSSWHCRTSMGPFSFCSRAAYYAKWGPLVGAAVHVTKVCVQHFTLLRTPHLLVIFNILQFFLSCLVKKLKSQAALFFQWTTIFCLLQMIIIIAYGGFRLIDEDSVPVSLPLKTKFLTWWIRVV